MSSNGQNIRSPANTNTNTNKNTNTNTNTTILVITKETHLIEICDDPNDVATSEDKNNEDQKGSNLLVALLSTRCLTVSQTRVLLNKKS